VSKAASSLAEQMKGRGARPLKGLIEGLQSPEERKAAIATSDKPDCLIVDLVGITGLSDSCSTVEIYAQGMRDEVIERAEELLLEGEEDVEKAIDDAKEQIAAEERQEAEDRRQREAKIVREAARRAAAGATADYSEHERGYGAEAAIDLASEKQIRFMAFLGLECVGWEPSRRQARQMITLLKERGLSPEETARAMRLTDDDWRRTQPTSKQKYAMTKRGIAWTNDMTPAEASDLLDRRIRGGAPGVYVMKNKIKLAQSNEDLNGIGKELVQNRQGYSREEWDELVEAGRRRRAVLQEDF
jgi:hypothetical protein